MGSSEWYLRNRERLAQKYQEQKEAKRAYQKKYNHEHAEEYKEYYKQHYRARLEMAGFSLRPRKPIEEKKPRESKPKEPKEPKEPIPEPVTLKIIHGPVWINW